jgi:methionine synthase I (cobalamin-dependent)
VTSIIAQSAPPANPTSGPRDQSGRGAIGLLDAIDRGPLVLDAGMGTRLGFRRPLDLRVDDPCLWNLDHPEDVLDVHRRDAAAGSRVLFTNTFGANGAWLTRFARRGDVEPINRAGVDLARRAAGPSGFVVGDIGPSTSDEPGAAGRQAASLIVAGVDALILETFRLESAIVAMEELHALRETPPVPLIVSLWRWPDAAEEAARRLVDAGADVVGFNCRPAMSGASALARRLAGAVACPLLVKPGAAGDDPAHGSSPAAFAAAVPELIDSHVRLIGGCCGTTEAHIAALSAACTVPRNPDHPDPQDPRGAAT